MKRKMTAIILSFSMVLSMIPSSSYAAIIGSNTVIKGKANISNIDCYDFSVDFRDLTVGSNKVYSDELSVLSILLSADMGNPGYIRIVNGDNYLLEQLGFEDVRRIDFSKEYENGPDSNDWAIFFVGRKTIRIGFVNYVIYAVAVRGTVDSDEWMSNYEFGADTPEYEKMCGAEHPDWIERYMHKGFNVTANRVYNRLIAYMDEYASEDNGKKRSILITGHSRGAAVANILGKKFEDKYNEDKKIKPYTYTFGTPNVTTEEESVRSQYKTIFNIINDDDVVPYIPLNSWGFYRYGRDIHGSVEKKYKDDWKADNMGILLNLFASGLLVTPEEDADSVSASTLVDGKTYDYQNYSTASGNEAEEFLPDLLSAYPLTRKGEYEFRDIVWIPKNISENYSKYYIDLPYGSLDGENTKNKIKKSKYDTFARITKCKRVKTSTMFFFYTVNKIFDTMMSAMGETTVEKTDELIEYISEHAGQLPVDTSFYKSLLEESDLDKDILNLLCMFLVTYDRDIESGPTFVKALMDINDRDVLSGFLCAHMPTTYYFLVNQNIEKKDIRPTIMKVHKGKQYEISSNIYKVTSVLQRKVSLVDAGNAPVVFIPNTVNIEGEAYKVTGLGANTFEESEARTVVIETKWLTKTNVKSAFKNSDVSKAIIMVGNSIDNYRYLRKYSDFFKESIVGKNINLITN